MSRYLTFIKSILVTLALSLTFSAANAVQPDEDSAVSQNFKKVGRSFRSIGNANNSAELIEALQTARAAMVANKSEVPSFMEEGSTQLEEFKEGLDDAISRIDTAIAMAEADDFEGAKAQFDNIRGAKEEYHDKFEIEEAE